MIGLQYSAETDVLHQSSTGRANVGGILQLLDTLENPILTNES